MSALVHGEGMAFEDSRRPLQIASPFPDGQLLVRSLQGEEHLSALFRYTVELASENPALDFSKIVGEPVTLSLHMEGGERHFWNGVVGRFTQAGRDARFTVYSMEVHPWLWLLTMHSDCRIFQNLTAPEIVKQVFDELGFKHYRDALTRTYAKRDYAVQYREDSFRFVSRLLEEEGIYYFFEHRDGAHTLVLGDDPATHEPIEFYPTVRMEAGVTGIADPSVITDCAVGQRVTVQQYKTQDYNYLTPRTDLLAAVSGKGAAAGRSIYQYPAGRLKRDLTARQAELGMEAAEAGAKILSGTSHCFAFRPGRRFTLAGHPRDDFNAAYVLTSVNFQASGDTPYSNAFEAIPLAVPFRPACVTAKPTISGAQTATVVGKQGEEIWTDPHGRILVHFHWDLRGQRNENDSCWIRVAQAAAGKQWGVLFLPRVGQEVVVSFLDGDPDRPIVTGCVYNGEQQVPYTLPEEGSKSTIKSAGFNEIRFEDKKDAEELLLRAQRDLNVTVLNDLIGTVTNNRTVTVLEKDDTLVVQKGNRAVKVPAGNETHEVKGTRSLAVGGAETRRNEAGFGQEVTGAFTLKVTGDITIEASGSIRLKAGGSVAVEAAQNVETGAGADIRNRAGVNLTQEAGVSIVSEASASQTIDGGGMLALKGGMVGINS